MEYINHIDYEVGVKDKIDYRIMYKLFSQYQNATQNKPVGT